MAIKTEKRKNGKLRVKIMFTENDGKTKQEFKDECQIQNIINKYHKTGMITHLAKHQGDYGDFSKITSYQDAVMAVMDAEQTFSELPANIRSEFQNDPGKLLAFVEDDKNYDKAVELGLLKKVEQAKQSAASQELTQDKKAAQQNSVKEEAAN